MRFDSQSNSYYVLKFALTLYFAIELLENNNPYVKPKTGLIKHLLLIISQVKSWF